MIKSLTEYLKELLNVQIIWWEWLNSLLLMHFPINHDRFTFYLLVFASERITLLQNQASSLANVIKLLKSVCKSIFILFKLLSSES